MILSNRPKGLGRVAAAVAAVVLDAAEAPAIHPVEEHVGYREPAVASCEDAIAVVSHAALYHTRG